jgi:hypothetical protein
MKIENGKFFLSFPERLILVAAILAVSSLAWWYSYLGLVWLGIFVCYWLYARTKN